MSEMKKKGTISDAFTIISGTTPSTSVPEYWKNGTVIWVTPADLSNVNEHHHIGSSERLISELALQKTGVNLVPKDTIIMSTIAPVGTLALAKEPLTFNQGCHGLVNRDDSRFYTMFYYFYLLSKHSELQNQSGGSTFKELSMKRLKDFPIPIIPLSEQKRIANTLSAVDKAIEQAGIAIEKSERMKRGLMQKLLNGSESNTSLKDIFDFKNGKKYTGITGNIPIYGGNGILGYATETNCDNAIIIGRVGANCGSVHYENSKCWVSDNAIICKKKIECSYEYLYYTLLTLKLNTIHVGSGQPLMTKSILDKISVYIPPLEKQGKIVQILLNADEEIKLKNHRKSLLETLKRGMMQQLFAGAK